DRNRRMLAVVELHVGLRRGGERRRSKEYADTTTGRERGDRIVFILSRALEGQHVRAEPSRMLLGQRVVVLGENSCIQSTRDIRDPIVMESMEDPRINASPVVSRHGSSSPDSGVFVNYIRPGAPAVDLRQGKTPKDTASLPQKRSGGPQDGPPLRASSLSRSSLAAGRFGLDQDEAHAALRRTHLQEHALRQ